MVGRVTLVVYVRRLAFASADSGSVAVFSTQIHTIDNRIKDCDLALVAAQRFSAASGHILIDDIPNGICIVLRPRTNVDMHDASAPGQILIEDITNWICIALRPRAGASCSMACEGCIVQRYEL